MIGFGIGSRAPQLANAGRATAIERDDSRSPWYRLLLRPTVLLVAMYSIAICFERIIEIEFFKPYRIIGLLLVLLAFAGRRLIVDKAAKTTLLYLTIGLSLGALHVISVTGFTQGLLGDSGLWMFNLATYVAISSLLRSRREVIVVLLAHAVAMVAASYDILLHSAELLAAEGASIRVSGDFKNPATACLSMLVASLVLITLLRRLLPRQRSMVRKLLVFGVGAGVVGFELYVASLTGSRAGALLFLVGVMVYLLVLGRRQVAVAIAALGLGAVVLLGQLDAWPQQDPASNILVQRSENKGLDIDRIYLWRSGLDAYLDSFGLGVGIGQYRWMHQEYYQPYVHRGDPRLADYRLSLHSDYVIALVEFGSIGFLVFMALVRELWRSAKRIVDLEARAMAMAMLAATALNSVVHASLPYFGLWFYLALLAIWLRVERGEAQRGLGPQ